MKLELDTNHLIQLLRAAARLESETLYLRASQAEKTAQAQAQAELAQAHAAIADLIADAYAEQRPLTSQTGTVPVPNLPLHRPL